MPLGILEYELRIVQIHEGLTVRLISIAIICDERPDARHCASLSWEMRLAYLLLSSMELMRRVKLNHVHINHLVFHIVMGFVTQE